MGSAVDLAETPAGTSSRCRPLRCARSLARDEMESLSRGVDSPRGSETRPATGFGADRFAALAPGRGTKWNLSPEGLTVPVGRKRDQRRASGADRCAALAPGNGRFSRLVEQIEAVLTASSTTWAIR